MKSKYGLFCFLSLVLAGSPLGAQTLSVGDGISISSTSVAKIVLQVSEKATYRVENLTHDSIPVEFSVSSKSGTSEWVDRASNRNWKGTLDAWVEIALDPAQQNQLIVVPPPALENPLRFRLQRVAFAGLRETLKQDLTYPLAANLPLRERLVWSTDRLYDRIHAARSQDSTYVAALSADKTELQVFSLTERTRVGAPVNGKNSPVVDFGLATTQTGDPLVWFATADRKIHLRQWNRTGWIDQTPDATASLPARWVDTPAGPALLFQSSDDRGVRQLQISVWNHSGWKSLPGLAWSSDRSSGPQETKELNAQWWNSSVAASVLFSPRKDGISNQVLWTKSGDVWTDTEIPQMIDAVEIRSAVVGDTLFTSWKKADGTWLTYKIGQDGLWQILPQPRWNNLEKDRSIQEIGSGSSLWVVESNAKTLQLHQFDTLEWRTPLKLAALTPQGWKDFELFSSSNAGRSASLILVSTDSQSTRFAVYDLP